MTVNGYDSTLQAPKSFGKVRRPTIKVSSVLKANSSPNAVRSRAYGVRRLARLAPSSDKVRRLPRYSATASLRALEHVADWSGVAAGEYHQQSGLGPQFD